MTASAAKIGFGTLLKIGDGAGSEVFTTIAEVKNVSGVGMTQGLAEVTHMESADRVREFIPTLIDMNPITFGINFLADNTQHDAIQTDMKNGTKRNFKIVIADATFAFSAYITDFNFSMEMEAAVQASITLKPVTLLTES